MVLWKNGRQGRKKAFPLSVLLATLPSLILPLISFFVPYKEWISYSSITFAIVKFLQGMPAGGEFPGAICYLAESGKIYSDMPPWVSRRYMCSFSVLGPQIGLMLSMIVCLILKNVFPLEVLQHHGWQIVFLISGLLGFGGYVMRNILQETVAFRDLKIHHKINLHPVKTVFSKYLSRVVFGFFLSIFETVLFIVVSLIPLFYLKDPYLLSYNDVTYLSVFSTILRSVFLVLIGRLLIKYTNFPWLKTSAWGVIFFSILLYVSYLKGSLLISLLINIAILFLYSIQAAILPSLLAELFPTSVRYTGIAFSFNICDAILLTAVTSICYIMMSYNSASFVLLLTISGIMFLINMKNRLAKKHYYR
jgi:MFS transporter, MHS family, proline/betaine transporter